MYVLCILKCFQWLILVVPSSLLEKNIVVQIHSLLCYAYACVFFTQVICYRVWLVWDLMLSGNPVSLPLSAGLMEMGL